MDDSRCSGSHGANNNRGDSRSGNVVNSGSDGVGSSSSSCCSGRGVDLSAVEIGKKTVPDKMK